MTRHKQHLFDCGCWVWCSLTLHFQRPEKSNPHSWQRKVAICERSHPACKANRLHTPLWICNIQESNAWCMYIHINRYVINIIKKYSVSVCLLQQKKPVWPSAQCGPAQNATCCWLLQHSTANHIRLAPKVLSSCRKRKTLSHTKCDYPLL